MRELLDKVAELDKDILTFIGKGMDYEDGETFNQLALRVFELQYSHIPLYQRYCLRRGLTPEEVFSWEDIPPLPTDAFKAAELTLLPSHTIRTFITSGTANPEERGKVSYDEGGLRLMDATICEAAKSMLFPDGIKANILIIAPSPDLAPQMVMAYGMNRLRQLFGLPQSRFLVGTEGFKVRDLVDALHRSEEEGNPAAIFGGSFGFVNFFDYCRKEGQRFQLPERSRCLDAGGFKGRSREVEREELLDCFEEYLGVPRQCCVNLLGMTETASQFYDNNLRNYHKQEEAPSTKVNPPWTQTMVVDPDSLAPIPAGETGLLRHFDLANRGHICAIQTDDMGKMVEGGFEVFGRAEEGEAAGCSLSIDEMTRILEAE